MANSQPTGCIPAFRIKMLAEAQGGALLGINGVAGHWSLADLQFH